MSKRLSLAQKRMLRQVRDGADVWSRTFATAFREIERDFPDLILITKPMHAPTNGAEQQPYFGVRVTAKGRSVIDEA